MKKILSLAAACTLACSSLVPPVAAQGDIMPLSDDVAVIANQPQKNAVNEPTTADMERLIKLVKPKLDVPEECTEFSWDYSGASYYSDASWRFIWRDKAYSVRVNATADADGNILSYSMYRDTPYSYGFKLPNFTKKELEKTAVSFLKKLCPDRADAFRLTSSSSGGFYAKTYVYNFTRYENGVIVPDNTARLAVDYLTGEVRSLYCGYTDGLSFAEAPAVSADAAKDALAEAQTMQLSYRLKTEYDDDGKLTARKAYLVYTPSLGYLAADAVSGEIYTERDRWDIQTAAPGEGMMNNAPMADSAAKDEAGESDYQLSEKELEQLDVLKNLITREQAIQAVLGNEYLYIDSSATAVDAHLSRYTSYHPYRYAVNADGEDEQKYVWNISFSAPYQTQSEENGWFSSYMYATVDAKDGKILSFDANVPDFHYYVNDVRTEPLPERKYTEEQAEEIFRAFAETQVPDYMKQTRLAEFSGGLLIGYEKGGRTGDEYDYQRPLFRETCLRFVRVNEGVDFTYNSISGKVDRVSGKVTSFNYNWYDDVTFESPADAVSPEQAYRTLLDSEGFGLNYEINRNYIYKQYLVDGTDEYIDQNDLYETETVTRLVYSGYDYGSTTVGALSGKLVTYGGEEYVPNVTVEAYDDMAGHWAEAEVQMLCDLGLGFAGTSFRPDEAISREDYRTLLNAFGKYPAVAENESGLSDKNENGGETLTRVQAVRDIIDAAGYSKVARLTDIYVSDFADNSELDREDVGFIAIARGLGFIQGDMQLFRPYDALTRAEAVTMLFNFLKLSE